MARIFGFVVTAVWLVFAAMAFRASRAGAAADMPDVHFWYGVITFFLTVAAVVALVGTLRHRPTGPLK
jgi:hypothetical protein